MATVTIEGITYPNVQELVWHDEDEKIVVNGKVWIASTREEYQRALRDRDVRVDVNEVAEGFRKQLGDAYTVEVKGERTVTLTANSEPVHSEILFKEPKPHPTLRPGMFVEVADRGPALVTKCNEDLVWVTRPHPERKNRADCVRYSVQRIEKILPYRPAWCQAPDGSEGYLCFDSLGPLLKNLQGVGARITPFDRLKWTRYLTGNIQAPLFSEMLFAKCKNPRQPRDVHSRYKYGWVVGTNADSELRLLDETGHHYFWRRLWDLRRTNELGGVQ